MTNRLRTEIEVEEAVAAEEQVVAEKPRKKDNPDNFFNTLFTKGIVSPEEATKALPFILFLAFLAMIYIGNMHYAEKNIRQIEKLNKEVKELSWDFKTTKAEMAYRSTLSEVTKRADSLLNISVSTEPPQKITVQEEQP